MAFAAAARASLGNLQPCNLATNIFTVSQHAQQNKQQKKAASVLLRAGLTTAVCEWQICLLDEETR
jgi:hypothetical protein